MIKRGLIYFDAFLYPKKRWIILFDLLSFILLVYIFSERLNHIFFAYIVYLLAAYSLIITTAALFKAITHIKKDVHHIYHVSRYYSDIQYRMKIKLFMSVSINVSYAGLKLVIGSIYSSIWEIHLGLYYLIICIVRIILLQQVNYRNIGKNKQLEYKKYALCSYFLIALNLVLTGVVILMVYRNYTYNYPGYLIYIAALYTFYTAISAVYNMIKFRKYHSPLINAINIICFITALVSILSLQTAMLTQFGTESIAEKQMANGLTGTVICMSIFMISIYMIIHSKKERKKCPRFDMRTLLCNGCIDRFLYAYSIDH